MSGTATSASLQSAIGEWMTDASVVKYKRKAPALGAGAVSISGIIDTAVGQAQQRKSARRQAQVRNGKIPLILSILTDGQKRNWLEGQDVELTDAQKERYKAIHKKTRRYQKKPKMTARTAGYRKTSYRRRPSYRKGSSYRRGGGYRRSYRR